MRVWFDITNTPHVHFLLGIRDALEEHNNYEYNYTSRDFSETNKLLKQKIGNDFISIGGHAGKNKINKVVGLIKRFRQVYKSVKDYDISISNGSENAIWLSALKRKKSIAFGDNDTASQWTYAPFVDFAFFPNAINRETLNKQRLTDNKLYLYDGYKEDIYIANYKPDPDFLSTLPFEDYVIVRPENLMANYLRNNNVKSIVPTLLEQLTKAGCNTLYLPRYKQDFEYAQGLKNIYIPPQPVNGLDACYFSQAVLTGAGTLAREAACMSVPAVSFYAGQQLLAVDQQMIKSNMIFYSRDPKKIIQKVLHFSKNAPDFSRSQMVKDEVRVKLEEVINNFQIT